MTATVLLLSGTCEGPLLARALHEAGLRVHATVTRAEACTSLFGALLGETGAPGARADRREGEAPAEPGAPQSRQEPRPPSPLRDRIEVEARGFNEETLTGFLRGRHADVVLDATHPFAVRITQMAHAVCTRLGVPYVRYERPDWEPPAGTRFASSFAEAAEMLPALGRRIALTIGSKQLKYFAELHGRLEMHARILPAPESLAQAEAAGFSAERLLCTRPPFSREQNREWLARCRAEVLLTKASGQEGGVVEKVLAARDLGLEVLVIRRPQLPGVPTVSSLEAALAACLEAVEGGRP